MQSFRISLMFVFLLTVLMACSEGSVEQPTTQDKTALEEAVPKPDARRPNIVYILADDMGYADISAFGSEIPTPNLDTLARQGMRLTNFHTSLACSPTRSMLMSGTDNHLAGLGVMSPPSREDQKGQPGYEAYLNSRVASRAELMTDAGYNTYMAGKWHLGTDKETSPRARGFKRSFASLSGAAHLGGLSWNGPGLAPYRDGDSDANEIVNVEEDFYSTRFYTRRMIEYIEKDRSDGKPFFAWLAYTAPHWPLQAPSDSIARFRGWFDDGYEVLYKKRFNRMKDLGLIPEATEMFDDSVWTKRWDDLTDEDKRVAARRMEIYAAMVSDLDRYVGEFLDYLKEIGEYDNTFIVFSSDNGAESTRRELAEPLKTWVENCCDNSYGNMGSGTSYIMYGRDWATASTVAFRRHKATAFEGGIRAPAFVWYPKLINPAQSSDGFATVMDLLPTFLELAGSNHPGTQYKGREILPVKGRSLIPQLRGEMESVHPEDEYTGWELYGARAIRQGKWKIVWDAAMGDDARWMLFDLVDDPAESHDLSEENPEKLEQMTGFWIRYAAENGVIY